MGKREERQEPTRQSGVRERIATNEALAAGLGSLSFSLSLWNAARYTPLYTQPTHTAETHTHTPELPSLRVLFSSPCSLPNWIEKERRMCVCAYTAVGFWAFGYVSI